MKTIKKESCRQIIRQQFHSDSERGLAVKNRISGRNMRAIAILGIFAVVICCLPVFATACTGGVMEIVSEPALGALQKGNGLTPIVTVTVKNNSDKPITVMFHCVVYGSDGNKTTTISSPHELIMPGETVKITGVTANIYAVTEFNERCVRISALSYDVS